MVTDATKQGDTGAPSTVFLSYSRGDQKRAQPVIAALEQAGFKVWWDGLLEGGDTFLLTTEAALERADAVVVLWSKTSVDSNWVRDEASRGRDRGCLVPLSIDGSEPPLGFRQFQVIDISKWRGKPDAPEMQRAIRAVAALHGRTPLVVARQTRTIGRRSLIGGGVAVAVAAGGAGAWKWGLFGSGRLRNTIAVLPFSNMSGDASQAYFADGLSAEVRAVLARNAALQVVGQKSSESLGDRKDDAVSAARKLGVAYLLDGNVRIAGKLVRIAAELIDGDTGFATWSQSFERPMDDIFKVQSEIANAVTSALTAKVAVTQDRKADGGTSNVLAFDNYLRGRALYAISENEDTDLQVQALFDAAITADPNFAAAHAARARNMLYMASQYGSLEETKRLYAAAAESAQQAVKLAPDFADAQVTLGAVLFQGQLKIREARIHYDRALKTGGGDAGVLGQFAQYASYTGRRGEANAAIAHAQELDPLNTLVATNAAHIHYYATEYDKAITSAGEALAQNPKLLVAHSIIGDCQLMQGKPADARKSYLLERAELQKYTGLAAVEWKLGNKAEAQVAMAKIMGGLGKNTVTFYQQAQIRAQWGEADAGIKALRDALTAGDSGLGGMFVDPMLGSIRPRPEFSQLLKQLGFV